MLAANLSPEDQAIQSMPDVSPTKWHLAHTSWFFETFVLGPLDPGYRAFDPAFAYLFNSYYEAVGPRHPRPERGLLSRPTVDAIGAYRDHVTAAVLRLADEAGDPVWREATPLIELGLQPRAAASGIDADGHQARIFGQPAAPRLSGAASPCRLVARRRRRAGSSLPAGCARSAMTETGSRSTTKVRATRSGSSLTVWRSHPVTCGEYLDFIADGGYRRPEFWLSDGWAGGAAAGLAGAALLARRGRRVAHLHAGGRAADRAGRAGLPCQLLRGRRVCPLGRKAPADRGGMGESPPPTCR